jgi:hypothetical protein
MRSLLGTQESDILSIKNINPGKKNSNPEKINPLSSINILEGGFIFSGLEFFFPD